MNLELTALSLPAGANERLACISIAPEGATLGRGEGNTWVLPDAQQVLSQQHCRVFYEQGEWYVTDTSTNGVFLNSASLPLGRNSTHRLGAGDTLDLGSYRFRVSLPTAEAALLLPPSAATGLFTGLLARLQQGWGQK